MAAQYIYGYAMSCTVAALVVGAKCACFKFDKRSTTIHMASDTFLAMVTSIAKVGSD